MNPSSTPPSDPSVPNEELDQFLGDFKKKKDRAPRVLHVGNIANNAYINAKILNNAGFDCDVICYDYFHIMGTPEWQDADFDAPRIDQLKPDWSRIDLNGFIRPRWFAQGPVLKCIDYLLFKRRGQIKEGDKAWKKLSLRNGTGKERDKAWEKLSLRNWTGKDFFNKLKELWLLFLLGLENLWALFSLYFKACADPQAYNQLRGMIARISERSSFFPRLGMIIITPLLFSIVGSLGLIQHIGIRSKRLLESKTTSISDIYSFPEQTTLLQEIFLSKFKNREDKLSPFDFQGYQDIIPKWKELFDEYDLIQAYSTDPILTMLADSRPYIAYEHGTLRSHTQGDDSICRLTSLAYNLADHTFITNGDCLAYAKKIGVKRYSAMIHPIDDFNQKKSINRMNSLKVQLDVDLIFLCTLRHDWEIKGTDKYIRALPMLRNKIEKQFRVVMTEWGAQLDESKKLAENLGVSHLIHWIAPLPKFKLGAILRQVDIVFDQIALPHFGATAPEGVGAGVPVLMSYDPKSTEWIIEQEAPILSCWTPEEIVDNVIIALDPIWLRAYKIRAKEWFDNFHSSKVVLEKHILVYRDLLLDN